MDTKCDKSAKQCVNCPGRTDHDTADCPLTVLREWLHGDRPGWDIRPAIRALLTEQPQASAAQSAPAGEREAFAEYASRKFPIAERKDSLGAHSREHRRTADEAFQAGAAWQRTQSAGVPDFAGIGRDAGHPRAVVLYLRAEPTDDDLRAIQEALRFAAAPAQPAAQDRVRAALSPENQRVVPVEPLLADPHPLAAAHDQGEVQRLREALEGMLEYFPEGASDGECFAVDAARAALAASTGQEV